MVSIAKERAVFARVALLGQLVCTAWMVGVIWVIQLVHYPSFAFVDPDVYAAFQGFHEAQVTWAVGPPMLGEIGCALALVLVSTPDVSRALAWVGLALVGLIWFSTATMQVPAHAALGVAFDADVHRQLVNSNWLRTCAWTLRLVIAVKLLLDVLLKPIGGAEGA